MTDLSALDLEDIHGELLRRLDLRRTDVSRMSDEELWRLAQQHLRDLLEGRVRSGDRAALERRLLQEVVGYGVLEDLLRDMGARVVDVFAAAGDALAALNASHYDCAILDILVRDGTCEPVADALAERGIPFLFSSGVGLDALPPRHQSRRLISKPFDDSVLAAQISDLLHGRSQALSPA